MLQGSLIEFPATHCPLFFMQDGGCSCPGDVAKAFGKDSVWYRLLHPALLQHSRSQCYPECVISSRLHLSLGCDSSEINTPDMNLVFGPDGANSAVQNIWWLKSYLETLCQLRVGHSHWDSHTKNTDKGFFGVGFKDACDIARSG